ncbi:hypothetical protein BO86DRAFT_107308 [Aspergillus japonicus CBS 114.51]|uniref:Uncharacterized protein n=1 Tax=Aspergillus japonicus CBS 114.51 TaxID=1448312 RepID=A0A8T8WZM0_ASPJA|nr:hypothetical protein BO86DRAFT_107308 [Aspergillus japonicus CBS 114.51]RAH81104.1 hypothetical protein BO86DRAFT_107308 [Aspergillus japonicus CBS 114.51]
MFAVSVWFSVPLGYCNCPPRLLTRPAHYTGTNAFAKCTFDAESGLQYRTYHTTRISDEERCRVRVEDTKPGSTAASDSRAELQKLCFLFGIRTEGGIPRDEGG